MDGLVDCEFDIESVIIIPRMIGVFDRCKVAVERLIVEFCMLDLFKWLDFT